MSTGCRPTCRRRSLTAPPRCRRSHGGRSIGSLLLGRMLDALDAEAQALERGESPPGTPAGQLLARRARGRGRSGAESDHGTCGRNRRRRVAPARRRGRAGGIGVGEVVRVHEPIPPRCGMSEAGLRPEFGPCRTATPTVADVLAAQRDRAAFDVLYRRYLDRVYGYAFYQLRRPPRRRGRHRAHLPRRPPGACRSSVDEGGELPCLALPDRPQHDRQRAAQPLPAAHRAASRRSRSRRRRTPIRPASCSRPRRRPRPATRRGAPRGPPPGRRAPLRRRAQLRARSGGPWTDPRAPSRVLQHRALRDLAACSPVTNERRAVFARWVPPHRS